MALNHAMAFLQWVENDEGLQEYMRTIYWNEDATIEVASQYDYDFSIDELNVAKDTVWGMVQDE